MKKAIIAMLSCAILFTACAAPQNADFNLNIQAQAQTDEQTQEIEERGTITAVEARYTFEYEEREEVFCRESDGTVYASYKYRMPMMGLGNPDELSQEAREIAQRNVEAFNAQMSKALEDAVAFGKELANGEYSIDSGMPVADEKIMTVWQTGQVITIFADGYLYSGGAHPYVYTDSDTFDLTVGQFIDPAQIGDDPEAFRVQTATLLVACAQSLGEEYTAGYYDDYAEVIAQWSDATVLFREDGMTVIFSPYELGPYAMGPVELFLSYEELAEAIGAGGLAHLGIAQSGE